MWLDVEEEQEFAWLMSEIFAATPLPLPGPNRVAQVLWEEQSDEEDLWGMDTFTSVLSLSKKKLRDAEITRPQRVLRSTEIAVDAGLSDQGKSAVIPACLLIPPPRSTSRPTTSQADTAFSSSSKHRPPPLSLPSKSPLSNHKLPQVVQIYPDQPDHMQSQTVNENDPTTPFVRPRVAPHPRSTSILIPVPTVKKSPPIPPIPGQYPKQHVSFFEPVTPVDHGKGRTGNWLKKVVGGGRV